MKRTMIVLVLVFSLAMLCVSGITIKGVDNVETLSEENTTEYAATFISITITDSDDDYECRSIYTKEYGDKLAITYMKGDVNIADIDSLKAGQTIFFRIENVWADQFGEMPSFGILSLRTEEREIFSLSSSAKYQEQQFFRVKMTAVGFIPILLLLSIHCVLLLRGINVFKKLP